jgi:hypothetical protein
MPERSRLDSLVAELRGLRGSDRSAILHALSADDRARLARLLAVPRGTSGGRAEPVTPLFSPWLSARIAGPSADATWQISPATRDALAAAVRDLGADTTQPSREGRGRSLAGAFGDLLKRPRR